MAEDTNRWHTTITKVEPNCVSVRGYDIAELMDNVSFGAAVHLILRGELPSSQVAKLMDAILVSLIAHAHEEKMTQKPMRKIDAREHEYAGPPPRPLKSARSEAAR